MSEQATGSTAGQTTRRPRLGFLGVGWIGRARLEALARSGVAEIAALADPEEKSLAEASRAAPHASCCATLDDLLALDLDGVVIATPSALHAGQAIAALRHGVAVFCQKPLARTAAETRAVIDAARAADRLLDVDLSYRFTQGARALREIVQSGELGDIFAADLVFHNAYGPDRPWFRDVQLSGGGCLIDLGIHLVDLALWMLDWPTVSTVHGRLFAGGEQLLGRPTAVEDYALAEIGLASDAVLRLACSWNLHAGRDAVIEATFYGTRGSASLRNVNGSFYDFTAERFHGTARDTIASPPDVWGGRAAVSWATRLAENASYDPAVERVAEVAAVLDRIYGR